jgi:hypothetical protein
MLRKNPTRLLSSMLGLIFLVPAISAGTRKEYPFKYAVVDMPISLRVGVVRTPGFPVVKEWYDIMILVQKPADIPFHEMECMLGTLAGPLEWKGCKSNDPLLRADWAVWDSEHVPGELGAEIPPYPKLGTLDRRIPNLVVHGTNSSLCDCIFTDKYIFRMLGSFPAEAGKEYVALVRFTSDGSALDIANPHMIVIKHKDMW